MLSRHSAMIRDDPHDLVHSNFPAIARFKRAPWAITGVIKNKDGGLKKRAVKIVEWTVNENVDVVVIGGERHGKLCGLCGGSVYHDVFKHFLFRPEPL